jgi:hypothetical protein
VVSSCKNFDSSLALESSDMRPNCDTAFVSKSQLPLGIIPAAVHVTLVSKAKRVVCACCHHHHSFAEHGLYQNGLVSVLCGCDSQLALRAVAAGIDVALVCQN